MLLRKEQAKLQRRITSESAKQGNNNNSCDKSKVQMESLLKKMGLGKHHNKDDDDVDYYDK